MPIQPGLALQLKGAELPDPMAQFAQATQIQNALQQQRMGEMQIQNAMREQQRKQRFESTVAGFQPGMGIDERVRALQQQGLTNEAMQFAKTERELEKQRLDAETAHLTKIKTVAELTGRFLTGVKADPSTYPAVRQQIIARGLATDDELPKQYDPAFVDRVLKGSLSVKDQAEIDLRSREVGARETSAGAAASQAATAAAKLPLEERRTVATETTAKIAADRAAFEQANPGFTTLETDQGVFKVNKRTGAAEPLIVDGTQLQTPAKGSRPQLLMLQDELRQLETKGEGDTERAQQIRDQIRASTSKGAVELSPKDVQAREAKYPQATLALRTFDEKTDELISDLKTLRNHPGLSGITGLIAGRTPAVTGDARNAKAILDKILARGGFQELQNLRNASPTGGALGQVSNTENQFLRQAFGTLDPVQDTKDFKRGVDQVIRELEGSKSRVRDAYDLTYEYRAGKEAATQGPRSTTRRGAAPSGEPNAPAEVKSDADYDKLPSGATFRGPDGVLRRKP